NREVNGRRVESGKLQLVVEAGLIAVVNLSRLATLCFEVSDDCGADLGVLDVHDPPRLAVADRWREIGKTQQTADQSIRHRVRLEPAHVAAPADELLEVRRGCLPRRGIVRIARG